MELKHKGHTITVDSRGNFRAAILGDAAKHTTLRGIQKMIAAAVAQKPFKAFLFDERTGAFTNVEVMGTRRPARRHYASERFVLRYPDGRVEDASWQPVYVDTPENRAAVKAWYERTMEVEAIKEKLHDEIEALSEKLKYHRPSDQS